MCSPHREEKCLYFLGKTHIPRLNEESYVRKNRKPSYEEVEPFHVEKMDDRQIKLNAWNPHF